MKIKCPACAAVLNIPESAAGKVVKCPCGKQLRAPSPSAAPAAGGPAGPKAAARPAARQPAAPMGDFDPGIFDELTDQDLQPVKTVARPGIAPAPTSTGGKLLQQYASTRDVQAEMLVGRKVRAEIAGVGRRISGALLDGLFFMVFISIGVGVVIAVGAGAGEEQAEQQFGIEHVILLGFYVVPAIVNAVLISMSGQSLGKKLVGTVMVSENTGAPVGFTHGFLIRSVGFGFFTGLPLIGAFIALADIVYLFMEDHQTLHDKLAHTLVVLK